MTLNGLVISLVRCQGLERDIQGGRDGEVVRDGSRIAIRLRPNPQNGQALGRVRASWLIAGLAAIGVVGFVVEPHIKRERQLPRLETSAAPLVAAIRAYQADTGYAPASSNVLIPKYIERLPTTGYRPVQAFSYSRGPGPEWTLEVPSTSLSFEVDTFQYYSRVPGWRLVPAVQVR